MTLGMCGKNGGERIVTIELKHFPTDLDIVFDLVNKLGECVRASRTLYGFFAMIGNPKYINAQRLDLTKLGIEEHGKYSFYEWRTLKPPFVDNFLETLVVGFMKE